MNRFDDFYRASTRGFRAAPPPSPRAEGWREAKCSWALVLLLSVATVAVAMSTTVSRAEIGWQIGASLD